MEAVAVAKGAEVMVAVGEEEENNVMFQNTFEWLCV